MNELERLREEVRTASRAYIEARNAYDAARDAGGDDCAINMGRAYAAIEAAQYAHESAYEALLEAVLDGDGQGALP